MQDQNLLAEDAKRGVFVIGFLRFNVPLYQLTISDLSMILAKENVN